MILRASMWLAVSAFIVELVSSLVGGMLFKGIIFITLLSALTISGFAIGVHFRRHQILAATSIVLGLVTQAFFVILIVKMSEREEWSAAIQYVPTVKFVVAICFLLHLGALATSVIGLLTIDSHDDPLGLKQ